MSLNQPPQDSAEQLQWLLDRAAISDLLIEYARSVDERDWDAFAALWADDAIFALPMMEARGRDAIVAAASSPGGVSAWDATHHINTNHEIQIAGDAATARAYLIGTHVRRADAPDEHSEGGGWYDCTFRRTRDGWRYASSRLSISWHTGTDLPRQRDSADE